MRNCVAVVGDPCTLENYPYLRTHARGSFETSVRKRYGIP